MHGAPDPLPLVFLSAVGDLAHVQTRPQQVREHGRHAQHAPAHGRGRAEALGGTGEADVGLACGLEEVIHVADVAREAVQPVGHDHTDGPGLYVRKQLLVVLPVVVLAAADVLAALDDTPAFLLRVGASVLIGTNKRLVNDKTPTVTFSVAATALRDR